MKTTIELPDDLMRAIKVRAAREDRKLKDLVAELLRQGLDGPASQPEPGNYRVKLPLITGGHPDTEDRLTPERVHEILLAQEVEALIR